MSKLFLNKKNFFILLFFFICTYLLPLNSRLLWQPDETRYAEISREMLQKKNWIVPYLLDIRYFEKPVGGYWINNFFQILFPNSNFGVRFSSVFCTLVTSVLVYSFAIILWKDKNIAFIASFIYLSMFLVFLIGTYNTLDSLLTMWISFCMFFCFLCFRKFNCYSKIFTLIFSSFSLGIAFLTKGLVSFITPLSAVCTTFFYKKFFKRFIKFFSLILLLSFLVSFPWILAIHKYESDFWNYFFWKEHIHRFFSENAQHRFPFWFYFPVLFFGTVPWFGFLFNTIIFSFQESKKKVEFMFLFFWFLIPFLFFSISKGKLITYILPIMFPISLMMSKYISFIDRKNNLKIYNSFVNIFLGFLLFFILIFDFFNENFFYSKLEWSKLLLFIIIIIFWILCNCFFLFNFKFWLLFPLCSLGLSLFLNNLLPQKVIDSKLSQGFIRKNLLLLKNSEFILSNNVGLATILAWELKRSDIFLYEKSGELSYGLSYPDSFFRFFKKERLLNFLNKKNKDSHVALVLLLSSKSIPKFLSNFNKVIKNSKVAIIFF